MRLTIFVLVFFISVIICFGQESSSENQNWNFHFQQTIITQYHIDFFVAYSGKNSLQTSESPKTTLTSTFFIGRKLWNNAELYFNPELGGGNGLSGATGVAGFVNGEAYRIGDPTPEITVARFFIKQIFPLSNASTQVNDTPNQLARTQPTERIVLSVGKISMTDFFDNNSYSHDPRTQFFNWSLMSNGAWDYAANTRGYTWGVVGEVFLSQWAFRLSTAMVPTEANMSTMDKNLSQAHSETIEIEHSYQLNSRQGTIRLLGYLTHARMGNYEEALILPAGNIDVVSTRAYGRIKYGFGINIEQALSTTIGMMLRYGWNDGRNETWMFTEIDNTISGAILLDGVSWGRKGDIFGGAVALNGISEEHRRYLAAGGYGFIIGDGALQYGAEFITELFYSFLLPEYHLTLSPGYQFVYNPAYNKNRGPVHVFELRAHIAF